MLGALFVFLLTFVAICFVVLRSKNNSSCHTSTTSNNTHQSNGTSQTGLQAQTVLLNGGTTITPATNGSIGTNGRIPNGNTPTGICNGGGTIRRLSNTSTDTKDSKLSSSNLLISSSGSASNSTTNSTNVNSGSMSRGYVGLVPNGISERKGALTIRANQLAEQIELCNYGSKTEKDNLDALNQAAFSEHSPYGSNTVSSGSFSKLMLEPAQGHYLGEDTNFNGMLNDNIALSNSMYGVGNGGNFVPCHYTNSIPIVNGSGHHETSRHYTGNSHYPLLVSNHTTGTTLDHYHAHPSCSAPSGKLSPSPVHYGNVVTTTTPLKPLSSLASSNTNSANVDYFGLDYYGQGLYGSMAQSEEMALQAVSNKLSSSATLQSHDHVDEFNKRRAAASVAEELQQRMAVAGVNCCETKILKTNIQLPSSGQVVQFANSPTVYSYSPSGPVSINAKQAGNSALSRVRNGVNGPMMVVARDSPDEGLGEETE